MFFSVHSTAFSAPCIVHLYCTFHISLTFITPIKNSIKIFCFFCTDSVRFFSTVETNKVKHFTKLSCLQTKTILFFVSLVPYKKRSHLLSSVGLFCPERNLFIPDILNIILLSFIASFLTFFQKFQMTNV